MTQYVLGGGSLGPEEKLLKLRRFYRDRGRKVLQVVELTPVTIIAKRPKTLLKLFQMRGGITNGSSLRLSEAAEQAGVSILRRSPRELDRGPLLAPAVRGAHRRP